MKKEEFKPYISDEHIQTEFTPTSIIIGILLSVVFGAANAYLGLSWFNNFCLYSCCRYFYGCSSYNT